ncbi:MAG: DegT/DnrJ/EryC1/StrS family aminotransferase [Lentisphaerae bacterium]|nr:DegT/DnrJ/EryC1/StrS family aminotransferase [Lentisphaerota bacterium]
MKVPFLNLRAHVDSLREPINAAIQSVLDATAFAGGPFVEKFEKEFATYCGGTYAAGVGNGTDALWLALLALGIGPGDEVITVPHTFIATAEAISLTGAKPVFVDITESTYTMDPALIEAAITPRTRAIMPVHLYGQPADMDPILAIARKHGLRVIEDACQAHGAQYRHRPAGSLADASGFSFYPGKNLGAFGEAGAVVSNHEDVIAKIKVLRDHGQPRKYVHSVVGWNARMDGIQGAVLSVKLAHLDAANDARRRHAARYAQLLGNVPALILPTEAAYARHIYHVYAVRCPQRDRVLQHMAERGVSCGIHYPVPLHLQEAYANLGLRQGTYPVSERCASEVLSLPMFPELTDAQILYVAEQLRAVLA